MDQIERRIENDALKMPKVLLAIIAAGVVVLIAVLVVAVFSL